MAHLKKDNLALKQTRFIMQTNNCWSIKQAGLLLICGYYQCDKIGRFLIFLVTNFLIKVAQILW